jgi:hypothetical protein
MTYHCMQVMFGAQRKYLLIWGIKTIHQGLKTLWLMDSCSCCHVCDHKHQCIITQSISIVWHYYAGHRRKVRVQRKYSFGKEFRITKVFHGQTMAGSMKMSMETTLGINLPTATDMGGCRKANRRGKQ